MIMRFIEFVRKKKRFEAILKANNLDLDYDLNKSSLQLLESIFIQREYADYFPFYENNIIIDIGAHRGYFSLFAALNSGEDSKIFSLEPVSSNFKILEQNIRQNENRNENRNGNRNGNENGNGNENKSKCKNITTMKAAVAAFDGQLEIHLSHDTNHSLIGDNPLSGNSNSTEKVKAITLDSLISQYQLDEIDFLKMDCEGAEYDILFNASDETLKRIKILSMEFHDLKDQNRTANSLIAHLTTKNFDIVKFQYEPTNLGLNYGKLIFKNQSITTSIT